MAWVPALGGWLVTSYAAAVAVMRDSRAFTVDDPRFSTARVVGPSMLSLDGAAHARHRAPFFSAFHRGGAAARLGNSRNRSRAPGRRDPPGRGRRAAGHRHRPARRIRGGRGAGPGAPGPGGDPVRLRPDRWRRHRPVRGPERRDRRTGPGRHAAFAELAADLRPRSKRATAGDGRGAGRNRSAPESRTVLADAARSGDLTTGRSRLRRRRGHVRRDRHHRRDDRQRGPAPAQRPGPARAGPGRPAPGTGRDRGVAAAGTGRRPAGPVRDPGRRDRRRARSGPGTG